MSWGFSTSTCTYTGSLTTHFWVVYPIYSLCPLVWNEAAHPWFQQLFLRILPLSPMFHKMYRLISAMCHDDICSLTNGLYLTIFSVLWWIASTIVPLAFIATVIATMPKNHSPLIIGLDHLFWQIQSAVHPFVLHSEASATLSGPLCLTTPFQFQPFNAPLDSSLSPCMPTPTILLKD